MPQKRITPGLSDNTLVTSNPREYKDIDLSFSHKRGTVFPDGVRRGDLFKKIDTSSVIQSIENILLTNWYEKPFQPLFGGDLMRLLFELNTTVSEPDVADLVKREVERHEPRVKVLKVDIILGDTGQKVPKGIEDIFYHSTNREQAANSMIINTSILILNTMEDVVVPINMNRIR